MVSEKQKAQIIHHEDGGIISISIKDDGLTLYVCEKCDKIWIGKLKTKQEYLKEFNTQTKQIQNKKSQLLLEMVKKHRYTKE